jgi:hypothetical protein
MKIITDVPISAVEAFKEVFKLRETMENLFTKQQGLGMVAWSSVKEAHPTVDFTHGYFSLDDCAIHIVEEGDKENGIEQLDSVAADTEQTNENTE